MAKDAGEILKEALSLPPEVRASIADSLFESLDTDFDEQAEEMWREGVRRRMAEIDSGAVRAIAWPEAHARLIRRIRG